MLTNQIELNKYVQSEIRQVTVYMHDELDDMSLGKSTAYDEIEHYCNIIYRYLVYIARPKPPQRESLIL